MDNTSAIRSGGLEDNPLFFGSSTSEIISLAGATGNWNGDWNNSVYAAQSWFKLGGLSDEASSAGVFTFWRDPGGGTQYIFANSHRTILLGY